MKTSFQDGVDSIYNKCVSCGSTPSNKTPTACATSIQTIYTNRYNTGYSSGRTQGQNDVKNSPNTYSLYTKTQYDNNYSSGYNAGVTAGSTGKKVVVKIGTGAGTYTITSSIYSGYKNLTASNFIIEATASARGSDTGATVSNKNIGSATLSISKSYVASTGKLTVSGASVGWDWTNGTAGGSITPGAIYLIV